MHCIVFIKQVPDITFLPPDAWDYENGTLKRALLDKVLNALDLHALTFALHLRNKMSPKDGKVVCVTMGPPSASEALLEGLARGADDGVLLTDQQFAGADTFATARVLAKSVEKIVQTFFKGSSEYMLIAGMQSVDGDTAQVPAQIAETLDVDLIAYATGFEYNSRLTVSRIGPSGMETIAPKRFPILMTVTGCTEPEYPSFERERNTRSRKTPYQTWNARDIGTDPAATGTSGSKTLVFKIFSPKETQKECRYIDNVDGLIDLVSEKLNAEKDEKKVDEQTHYSIEGKNPEYKGEIWTFAETGGSKLLPVALELAGKARELADTLHEKTGAVLIGGGNGPLSDELFACGADTVYAVNHPDLARFLSIPYKSVVADLIKKHKPQIMMFGATPLGRELAPRIACATESGLTADCTRVEIGDHRQHSAILLQTRPALGGNIMATIMTKSSRTQMATVRPGVFPLPVRDPSRKGKVIAYSGIPQPSRCEILMMEPIHDKADLSKAEIIVAGGSGIRTGENYVNLLGPLAKALSAFLQLPAETGASRRAVEAGFISRDYQIGQTGQTIQPSLYVAVGISGAVQHISGMQKSKVIVAINSDPKAPIFRIADIGFVGKAETVVPRLVEALQRRSHA